MVRGSWSSRDLAVWNERADASEVALSVALHDGCLESAAAARCPDAWTTCQALVLRALRTAFVCKSDGRERGVVSERQSPASRFALQASGKRPVSGGCL